MTTADLTPQQQVEFAELMAPLITKMATEMRKERGAEALSDAFLYSLACRAVVAAGAYMGDPRSIVRSAPEPEQRPCPQCGGTCVRRAGGLACIHNPGCTYRREGSGW